MSAAAKIFGRMSATALTKYGVTAGTVASCLTVAATHSVSYVPDRKYAKSAVLASPQACVNKCHASPVISVSVARRRRHFSTASQQSEGPLVDVAARSGRPARPFGAAPLIGRQEPQEPVIQRFSKSDEQVLADIKSLIRDSPIVLFMKGSPEAPQCGFSGRAVALLREAGCSTIKYIDVLRSERVRGLIKELTKWPTIPQLFIGGEFVGGVDTLTEMAKTNELRELLLKHGAAENTSLDAEDDPNTNPTEEIGADVNEKKKSPPEK